MRFISTYENFYTAISTAERVTNKNLPLEVLGYVIISAKKDTVIIKATNLDIGMEIVVPAKVEEEGEIAVSGTILTQLLTNSRDSENITIQTNKGGVEVKIGVNTATLKTYPTTDFPKIPKHNSVDTEVININIPAQELARCLRLVSYAASVSMIKPELASVYVNSEDNILICAATDSFRLAEKRILIKKLGNIGQILIPARNIPDMVKVLEGNNDDVKCMVTKEQFSFTTGKIYFTTRLVEGEFPNYQQIIPKTYTTEVVVLKHDLLTALKTTNIFTDKFSKIEVDISPKKKTFSLHTKNADIGEYTIQIDSSLSGDELHLSFNQRYIYECLQSIPTDSVSLSFSGVGKPLVIRGVSDSSFLYLVMPISE